MVKSGEQEELEVLDDLIGVQYWPVDFGVPWSVVSCNNCGTFFPKGNVLPDSYIEALKIVHNFLVEPRLPK